MTQPEQFQWLQANPGKAPYMEQDLAGKEVAAPNAIRDIQNASLERLAQEKIADRGSLEAYDRGTGRYWSDYSSNPTPKQTGTYDPIGGAQQSETAAMPFNMGGRYTKVNQGGSNMGELRNPDTASAYVKANLERHKAEDLAPQTATAEEAQRLKTAQYTPQQIAVMQGISKTDLRPEPVQPESEASKVQARLTALEYVREKQARANVQSRLSQLGAQVSPEKEAELLDFERQKLAQNPDAELSALAPRYRPDPYAAFNSQPSEQP
jgi:hypothetical protein